MLTQFKKQIHRQTILYIGLSSLLVILIVSGFLASKEFGERDIGNGIKTLFVFISIAGIAVAFLLLFCIRKTESRPAESMVKMARTLIDKDCASLKTAMNELTQGNMAVRSEILSQTLAPVRDPVLNSFVEILNRLSDGLRQASDEFNTISDMPCKRLCYVGGDSFLEGWRCGEAMGELLGGKGQVAITLGSFGSVSLNLRRKGFEGSLREKYPEIEVAEIYENQENPEIVYSKTIDILKRFPRLSGLYVTEGATPGGAARAVADSKKVQKVKIIGHDLTEETVHCIQNGWITAALFADPYSQGYEPVIHLFNHIVGGWQPPVPRLLTQMDVVTLENYKQFWEEGKGLVRNQMSQDRLTKPMDGRLDKSLKIVVLGVESSSFWYPVRDGALDAARKLEPLGVVVNWIIPEKARGQSEFSAAAFGPAVREAIHQRVDGISIFVKDKELVPYLNEAVDAGIPVITYNAEPFSMRSLVYTITQQADKLMGLSENLASSSQQVSLSTNQINTSMNQIAQGAVSQSAQVKETESVLDSLLTNIDKVSREAGESATSAESTAKAVISGTDAMDKTLGGIKSIEESVGETWKIVEDLRKHSERIDAVVELINDIASQVNVLALNAAIEATRAGEYGKGFMVVANEIRKLAKSTREATGEVTELVDVVQGGIRSVEKSMEEGLSKVQESAKLTDVAKEALGSIRELVEVNKTRMNKIASAIGEMQRFSHQVGESMGSVTSVSEKNAEAVEEIQVATEEMSAQFKEVAALARSLESMAQSEQELLAKFNVSSDKK